MDDGKQRKPGGRNIEEAIDRNLKRVYDDMLEDDVPDRFAELLKKLRDEVPPK